MPFNGTTRSAILSVANGLGVWDEIIAVYQRAKSAQSRLQLFQAGTDPKFNATINNIFTVAERQELAQMLIQINALVTDWETDHAQVIGYVAL